MEVTNSETNARSRACLCVKKCVCDESSALVTQCLCARGRSARLHPTARTEAQNNFRERSASHGVKEDLLKNKLNKLSPKAPNEPSTTVWI